MSVASYLNAHPRTKSQVRLEVDQPGVWLEYDYWPQPWKDRLELMYQCLVNDQALPIPSQVPLASRTTLSDTSRVGYASLEVGRDVYFAHVAHVLHLEVNGIVPWRLADNTDGELSYLLPSSNYFAGHKAFDGQMYYVVHLDGRRRESESILGDPRDAFRFMQQEPEEGKCLIDRTPADTAMNLTEWFHDYLWHWPGRDNPHGHDTYQGHPYLTDRLRRLDVCGLGRVYVAIGGCGSASALFADLMRAVNIPIRKTKVMWQDPDGTEHDHAGLLFDWQGGTGDGRYLAHTDDIYCCSAFLDPAPTSETTSGGRTSRGAALWDHVWLNPTDFGNVFIYDSRPDVLGVVSWEQGLKYKNIRSWLMGAYDAIRNACALGDPDDIVPFLQRERGFTREEAERAYYAVERSLQDYGGCDGVLDRHQAWCMKTGKEG